MNQLIAFCGLDCAACDGYKATQANDDEWKERVAAQWRVAYNAPGINTAYVTCDGCTVTAGQLGGHCAECGVRSCAVERGVANCAYCPDYETCETVQGFLKFVPDAKVILDKIYQNPGHSIS